MNDADDAGNHYSCHFDQVTIHGNRRRKKNQVFACERMKTSKTFVIKSR